MALTYYKMQASCSTASSGFISWVNTTGDDTGRPVCAGFLGPTTMVDSWPGNPAVVGTDGGALYNDDGDIGVDAAFVRTAVSGGGSAWNLSSTSYFSFGATPPTIGRLRFTVQPSTPLFQFNYSTNGSGPWTEGNIAWIDGNGALRCGDAGFYSVLQGFGITLVGVNDDLYLYGRSTHGFSVSNNYNTCLLPLQFAGGTVAVPSNPATTGILRFPAPLAGSLTLMAVRDSNPGTTDYVISSYNPGSSTLSFGQLASLNTVLYGFTMGIQTGHSQGLDIIAGSDFSLAARGDGVYFAQPIRADSRNASTYRPKSAPVNLAGGAAYSLSAAEAACPALIFTNSAGGGGTVVTAPNLIDTQYRVTNNGSGPVTITDGAGGLSTVTIGGGFSAFVAHDGTNYIRLTQDSPPG